MIFHQLNPSFLLLFVVTSLAGCRESIYSTEYNLDFEYAKSDSIPTQWIVKNPAMTGYSAYLDQRVRQHGQSSLRVQWDTVAMLNFGGFQNSFPGNLMEGRDVEVCCWIKTEALGNEGYATICLGEKSRSGMYSQQLDTLKAVRGTANWTRYTMKQRIGDSVDYVIIAGILSGRGTAWFDNIEIRIDGKKYKDRKIPALKTELTARDKRDLRKYIYPLRTFEPDSGDTRDLDILKTLVEGSKVVGLGECTHGTSEIYKMKDRIIRYLAENDGFDLFSIEANMPESARMNDYTISGEGDPKQLIRGMNIWPWMTEEMLDMVEWMRTYNTSEPKISFTGIDMQYPAAIMQELQRQVRNCPAMSSLVSEAADKLQHLNSSPFRLDRELADEIDVDLAGLAAEGEIEGFSAEQRELIRQYIDMLRQFLTKGKLLDWRDRGMAANLQWIMRQHPNSKILLWAHDLHIGRNEMFPMGTFLKGRLGDDYRTFGFAGYEGRYTAWQGGLKAFDLPTPLPGTLEYVLGQLDEPIFILNLKKMREENAPALQWLDDLEYREIASTPGALSMRRVSDGFDYLIFIRNTSASHILER